MATTPNEVFRALNSLTPYLIHTAGRAQFTPYAPQSRQHWDLHDKLWRDYNGLFCTPTLDEAALAALVRETLLFSITLIDLNQKLR